jgi:hypothetical protein
MSKKRKHKPTVAHGSPIITLDMAAMKVAAPRDEVMIKACELLGIPPSRKNISKLVMQALCELGGEVSMKKFNDGIQMSYTDESGTVTTLYKVAEDSLLHLFNSIYARA